MTLAWMYARGTAATTLDEEKSSMAVEGRLGVRRRGLSPLRLCCDLGSESALREFSQKFLELDEYRWMI